MCFVTGCFVWNWVTAEYEPTPPPSACLLPASLFACLSFESGAKSQGKQSKNCYSFVVFILGWDLLFTCEAMLMPLCHSSIN